MSNATLAARVGLDPKIWVYQSVVWKKCADGAHRNIQCWKNKKTGEFRWIQL